MKTKLGVGERVMNILNAAVLLLICALMLYPYLNQIAFSLNDGADSAYGGITIFVRKFTLTNYQTILNDESILWSFVISVARVAVGVAASLLILVCAAYALSKKAVPGRKKIILFLMIPGYIQAGLIPMYIMYRHYMLLNNFWVYILPSVFAFYNFIIIKTFFEQIPESIEESALLDGANELQVLFRIIIPVSMPVMATIALWVSVWHWNDWNTTLMFVTNRDIFPLQYVLMQLIKESEIIQRLAQESAMTAGGRSMAPTTVTPESIKSAVFVVATIPIIAAYPFLQKYFVSGIMLGAVKS